MKKMLVFLLLIGLLPLSGLIKPALFPLYNCQNVEKVCYVSSEKYSKEGVENVICGDKFFNFCSLDVAKQNIEKFNLKSDAVQFYINDISADEIMKKLNCQFISVSEVENMKIYYAYTPYFDKSVKISGKKINVQIAEKDGQVVAGLPLILTGY